MPIITKPSTIEKNLEASITLDKSALAALTSVAGDTYFSDTVNWRQVFIKYKSSVGNQTEIIKFDATQENPSGIFFVSAKARDIFEVRKIIIMDFDGGSFIVPRSQLTVSEFDIDMGAGSIAGLAIERNYSTSAPSGWSEGINGGAIVNNAVELYGADQSVIFTYSFGGVREARVFFDSSTSEVGMNLLLRSGQGGEYSYAAKSITLTEMQNGYFDTQFRADGPYGSAGYPAIRFANTPTSGKYLRITKIQIGSLV
jgi:hypothetical protein